jgi:hypothetical protein
MSQTNLTAVKRRTAPATGCADAKRRRGQAMAKQLPPVAPMERRRCLIWGHVVTGEMINACSPVCKIYEAARKAKRQLRGRRNSQF